MLCGMLDAVGAACGCAIAAIAIYGFGTALDLNPAFVDTAFYFNCAMVWALVSAPTGMVRALHRFDLAVYVEAVVPTGRLIAAIGIWWYGPTVGRFLFAWAVIDLFEAVCYWMLARRLCPGRAPLEHRPLAGNAAGEPGARALLPGHLRQRDAGGGHAQRPAAGGRRPDRHARGRPVPARRPADPGDEQAFHPAHPRRLCRSGADPRRFRRRRIPQAGLPDQHDRGACRHAGGRRGDAGRRAAAAADRRHRLRTRRRRRVPWRSPPASTWPASPSSPCCIRPAAPATRFLPGLLQ